LHSSISGAGYSMVAFKRAHSKGGRPPLERAGEVEERILDAAQQVFVKRGFEGASVDEIAQTARAGKPTIYARYPNKEALFKAVMARQVARNTQFENLAPQGRSLHAKLVNLGIALIERALDGETVGLMRSGIAEAERFPELTRGINEMARKRAAANLAKLLAELAREEGIPSRGAFAPDKITDTARIFLDLVLFAMFISRLLGEDVKTLKKELPAYVRQRVDFFLAACGRG
jgi:AcrR family transcriptional regulator